MSSVESPIRAGAPTPLGKGGWRHAAALWLLIAACESINGALREIHLRPWLGTVAAKQVGMAIGTVIILSIAIVFSRWLHATTLKAQLKVGAIWVGLTLAFEAALARGLGLSLDAFLADYDPTRGGLMGLGLLVLLCAPMLGARLHSKSIR